MLQTYTCIQYTIIHIIHAKINLSTVKWAHGCSVDTSTIGSDPSTTLWVSTENDEARKAKLEGPRKWISWEGLFPSPTPRDWEELQLVSSPWHPRLCPGDQPI